VDHELEVIRDQMEETRASLADKLEALESQVRETVQSATETVSSAVDGAKEVVSSVTEGAKHVVETVTETVETVKESLSIRRYVEKAPWTSLGVALAAGFGAAWLFPARRSTNGDYSEALPPASSGGYYQEPASSYSPPQSYQPQVSQPAQQQESHWTSALKTMWDSAAGAIESLAVGTVMSALKELAERGLPKEWSSELTKTLDQVTTRLGGKVMDSNPLKEFLSGESHQQSDQGPRT
jgi:ElaB/YqjD/DUF883 family membrane-anchored ribosome-binding protein